MQFSKVKVKHIYNVIFDPVRQCEFNLTHLAVVLKKNNDNKTCIVMPLTSEPNGVNLNKVNIGHISSLPSSLKNNNTYAVFNQIRTVNVSRFIALKETINGENTPIDCPLDDSTFDLLLQKALTELVFAYSIEEKMELFKTLYDREKLNNCIQLAYNVKTLNQHSEKIEMEKSALLSHLKELLEDFQYELHEPEIENGIQKIFDTALLTTN